MPVQSEAVENKHQEHKGFPENRYGEVSRKIQFRKELKRVTGIKPDWLKNRHLVITEG